MDKVDKTKENENNIVLVMTSGTMSGIFGNGFLTEFESQGFYSPIKAVYGISVGSINSAYFASGQSNLGPYVYTDCLSKNFILARNLPTSISNFLRYGLLHEGKREDVQLVDIDNLFEELNSNAPLDKENIRTFQIPTYVKVLNIDSGEIDYIDIREINNPLKLLRSAVTVIPYYNKINKFNGKPYIDAAVKEVIGVREILKRHPDEKIVIVLNSPIEWKINRKLLNYINEISSDLLYGDNVGKFFEKKRESVEEDIKLIKENSDRVVLIGSPEDQTLPSTTDSKKLMETYRLGREEGYKIIERIKNNALV